MTKESGQFISFFSYKGGVGRTMALANIAVLLARMQSKRAESKVLMIDWDLEAPGLHRYFAPFAEVLDDSSIPGLAEIFYRLKNNLTVGSFVEEMDGLIIPCTSRSHPGALKFSSLFLLPAFGDDSYATAIDWQRIHEADPVFFQKLATTLTKQFDYVLVDSRTGVTDSSGICSTILPEKLVAVFTANQQNIDGLIRNLRRAAMYRLESSDLRPFMIYPLVTRVELGEHTARNEWRRGRQGYQRKFEKLFEELYGLNECDLEAYFDDILIQADPYFSFGEKIAVTAEQNDRLSISRSFQMFLNRLCFTRFPWEDPSTVSYRDLGEKFLREAESLYLDANASDCLDLLSASTFERRRLFCSGHPKVAESLAREGALCLELGKLRRAGVLALEIMAIAKSTHGRNHVESSVPLIMLGKLCLERLNLRRAKALINAALQLRIRHVGPNHPLTAECYDHIAILETESGYSAQAQVSLGLASALREELVSASIELHRSQNLAMSAEVLLSDYDLDRAQILINRALSIQKHLLPPTHHLFSKLLVFESKLLFEQGEYERSLQRIEQVKANPRSSEEAKAIYTIDVFVTCFSHGVWMDISDEHDREFAWTGRLHFEKALQLIRAQRHHKVFSQAWLTVLEQYPRVPYRLLAEVLAELSQTIQWLPTGSPLYVRWLRLQALYRWQSGGTQEAAPLIARLDHIVNSTDSKLPASIWSRSKNFLLQYEMATTRSCSQDFQRKVIALLAETKERCRNNPFSIAPLFILHGELLKERFSDYTGAINEFKKAYDVLTRHIGRTRFKIGLQKCTINHPLMSEAIERLSDTELKLGNVSEAARWVSLIPQESSNDWSQVVDIKVSHLKIQISLAQGKFRESYRELESLACRGEEHRQALGLQLSRIYADLSHSAMMLGEFDNADRALKAGISRTDSSQELALTLRCSYIRFLFDTNTNSTELNQELERCHSLSLRSDVAPHLRIQMLQAEAMCILRACGTHWSKKGTAKIIRALALSKSVLPDHHNDVLTLKSLLVAQVGFVRAGAIGVEMIQSALTSDNVNIYNAAIATAIHRILQLSPCSEQLIDLWIQSIPLKLTSLIYHQIALRAMYLNENERAREYFQKAVLAVKNEVLHANVLEDFARFCLTTGDNGQAVELALKSIRVRRNLVIKMGTGAMFSPSQDSANVFVFRPSFNLLFDACNDNALVMKELNDSFDNLGDKRVFTDREDMEEFRRDIERRIYRTIGELISLDDSTVDLIGGKTFVEWQKIAGQNSHPAVLLQLAQAALREGRFTECVSVAGTILAMPQKTDAHLMRAHVLRCMSFTRAGNLRQAKNTLEPLRRSSDNPDLFACMALLNLREGLNDEAMRNAEMALKWGGAAHGLVALCAALLGNRKLAAKHCVLAATDDMEKLLAKAVLNGMEHSIMSKFAESTPTRRRNIRKRCEELNARVYKSFEEAISMSPKEPFAFFLRGRYQWSANLLTNALLDFERCASLSVNKVSNDPLPVLQQFLSANHELLARIADRSLNYGQRTRVLNMLGV